MWIQDIISWEASSQRPVGEVGGGREDQRSGWPYVRGCRAVLTPPPARPATRWAWGAMATCSILGPLPAAIPHAVFLHCHVKYVQLPVTLSGQESA